MPNQTSDNQSKRHTVNKTLLAIEVTIVLVIIFIASLLVVFFEQSKKQPLPTPAVVRIVDGNLTINAGSYMYYNFTVPGTLVSQVQGIFTVSDGSERIRVYIMDSANFIEWQNTHNASMYYDSGEVNSGNVTAILPPGGNYDLVYDNTFSSNLKNVTTQVTFDWL